MIMFEKIKYYYKAYFKRNIISNRKKNKIGHVGNNVVIENPFDYGDLPSKICIGNNTSILKNARINIYGSSIDNDIIVNIGDGCYIGTNFCILAKENVTIENNVLIASNVIITSENHGIDPECSSPYMDQELTGLPVKIGAGCWIGEKVIILPGVSIGDKSIIGAGSIVTKNVPSYSIAVGNPAKVIKKYNFSTHRWELCKDDLCCVER